MTAQTITSTPTNSAATAYSHQKKEATLSTGREVVVIATTGTNAEFWWSDDGFATKTQFTAGTSDIAGWSNGAIAPTVVGSTEYLVATWKQSGTGGGRADTDAYVMVGTFNAGRTTLTWGTAVSILGGAGSYGYPDLVVTPDGSGAAVLVVLSYVSGGNVQAAYRGYTVSGTTLTAMPAGLSLVGGNYLSATPGTFPSADIDHTTKVAHVAWSAGATGSGFGIRYRTFTLGSNVWTPGTTVEVDTGYYVGGVNGHTIQCRWDAVRSKVIVGGQWFTGGATWSFRAFESSNFTSFTNIIDSGTESSDNGCFVIDPPTGDIYITGQNSTYTDFGYRKWTRATSTLGSSVSTDTSVTGGPRFSYAWHSANTPAVRWIYTSGSSSPFSVKVDQFTLNTTPSIAVTSPADASSTTDTTPDFVLAVTDADPGQTLTVTVEIYSDSGLTTLVQTATNTTSTPASAAAVTVTATTLARSVSPYYWRAKVSDSTATSSWTATRTLTVGWDAPTVTIGASTPATTINTGGPDLTVTYTYAQAQSLAQASRRIRVQNAAGSTTYYDSGVIASATTTVTLDAVALGIPTDTTGTALKVVVDVVAATSAGAGTANKAFDIQWGVVSCTVTAPLDGAVVTDSTPTVDWTFASTRSKAQAHYRVRVLLDGTTTVHSDSGKTAGTDATYTVATPLVDNNVYDVEVTLWNAEGVSN